MAKSGSSTLWIFVPLLALVGAGDYYFYHGSITPPPEFITAKVAKADITRSVTATGDIQPVSTVEVGSQISGLVEQVLVDFNDIVKKDQVLARIDPATYESRLRQAEAEYSNTKANHDLVRLNAERIRSLKSANLVSQQELDQAEALLSQAEAQMLIRKASVENARVDLSRCTITSPIDGSVLTRQIVAGKTVAASLNAPVLFTLVEDLRRMQIEAAVSEADIGAVTEKMAVDFTVDAYPDRRFQGTVRQIRNTPVREQNVITYTTIIDVANDDLKLKPGMTANVSVIIEQRKGIPTVPNSALRVRIPEELLLTSASSKDKPKTPAATPEENLRALLSEVGHTGGRPTPEIMQRVRALAEERGLAIPARRNRDNAASSAITTRTLYRVAGSPEHPLAEPVEVRLGITNGTLTEVISGLSENDAVITGMLSAAESAVSGGASPFGSPSRSR
jgi:HlyD family secretion protein